MKTVSTVEHLLTTKNGDVGGLVLGDGMIVDVPPGHGDALKAMIGRGDVVRVEGDELRSPRGRKHVRAHKIAMKGKRFSQMPDKTTEVPTLAEEDGVVDKITLNRNGFVNGFRFVNGTVVKTPARESEKIIAHIRNGDEVHVVGHWGNNTNGIPRLIAEKIHVHHADHHETGTLGEVLDLPKKINRMAKLLRMGDAILSELQQIRKEIAAVRSN
jgi:hypothetical protein